MLNEVARSLRKRLSKYGVKVIVRMSSFDVSENTKMMRGNYKEEGGVSCWKHLKMKSCLSCTIDELQWQWEACMHNHQSIYNLSSRKSSIFRSNHFGQSVALTFIMFPPFISIASLFDSFNNITHALNQDNIKTIDILRTTNNNLLWI